MSATIEVYNLKSEAVEKIELSKSIFGAKWNPDLVHQALSVYFANRGRPYAHAKGRGEVRGGGKKPWRQKGTGRSRQGSIRSPLWRGGGVSHGPQKQRKFLQKISKKMKRLAMFSVFSKKLREGEIRVVQDLKIDRLKTKDIAVLLKKLFGPSPNVLIVGSNESKGINMIASNIPHVETISARSLNVYDLLAHRQVLIEKPVLEILDEHFKVRAGAK